MNTPNPLVPKSSLLEQQRSKGKSNLFIAVFTILAIHVILFAGLLMQGCRRAKPDVENLDSALTNAVPAEAVVSTNPPVPAPSTNEYYAAAPTSAPVGAPGPLMTAPTNLAAPLGFAETAAPTGEAKTYTVAQNDSFYKIAKAQGISISALSKANPNVDSRKLKVGQTLQIPAAVAKTESVAANASATGLASEPAAKPAASKTYTVKAGDTLTKVAKAQGVKVKALRDANKLKTDQIHVGQKLRIPTHKTAAAPAAAAAAPAGTPMAMPVESNVAPMPLAPAPMAPLTNRM
jgi:LysM repeat protein